MKYAPPAPKGAPTKKAPAKKGPPMKGKGVAKTLGSQFMSGGGC